MEKRRVDLKGFIFELDGISEPDGVIAEFYSHLGELKPGHRRKVDSDLLKLLLFEKLTGKPWRKYFVFACPTAASRYRSGNSWSARISTAFGINIEVIELDPEVADRLKDAQKRQSQPGAT